MAADPEKSKPLPLRDVTVAELKAAREESYELQQQLYEDFRAITQIPAEIWNMRFQ